ncbi:MAG: GlsB/YeaQ/YmgE family stress response membrane protein [Anaerolineae bacterium]|nr:GlsB/YeaQ/YmgE family stress response membrane protein [Anaerolineae bacterium]
MGLVSWIVFGALAGWVASLLMGTNRRQGCLMDIVIGVIGALLGGFLVSLLGGDVSIGWNPISFIVAVGGSILLLLITGAARRRR